jgi:hypothetical protein
MGKGCNMAAAAKTRSKKVTSVTEKPLNSWVQSEISRLSETHGLEKSHFEAFAKFVIENHKKPEPKPPKPAKPPKPLTLPQLKAAVYKHFGVADTKALKLSGAFQLATSSIKNLDLSKRPGWETLYRKLIGVLPNEVNKQGYGCVNGIDIFKYDMPWRAFGLDPQTSTTAQIKTTYHSLSRIYHPDNRETGDARIFDRLTMFYKGLTETF